MRATPERQAAEADFKGSPSLEGDASQGVEAGNQLVKEQISFNLGPKAQEAMVG